MIIYFTYVISLYDNWLLPSWIKYPFCNPSYLGLASRHLIQVTSTKCCKKRKITAPWNECCNIPFYHHILCWPFTSILRFCGKSLFFELNTTNKFFEYCKNVKEAVIEKVITKNAKSQCTACFCPMITFQHESIFYVLSKLASILVDFQF